MKNHAITSWVIFFRSFVIMKITFMSDDTNTSPADDPKKPVLHITDEETAEKLKYRMHEMDLAEKEKQTQKIAGTLGLPYIELGKIPILPDAISLISEEKAKKNNVLCFDRDEDKLKLATTKPDNPAIQETIKEFEAKDYHVEIYLVSAYGFEKGLYFYKTVPKIKELQRGISINQEDLDKFKGQFSDFKQIAEKIRKVSTSELLTFMVATAIESRASDIHVEAEEKGIIVRYRVDGILHEIVDLPREIWHKLDSRIKLISALKINVEDKPQDGSFTIKLQNDKIDVRVSTIPTNYGESIVMRILDKTSLLLGLGDLGFFSDQQELMSHLISLPDGIFLVTGPTGSGKTTTLYACLNAINRPDRKIITVEDPVEYQLSGINQVQVNPEIDLTFAAALRSILRQAPNIIMIGEIRDLETANIAVQSSLTGHLVFSTLHTNDAPSAVTRLIDMGVKPFLVASSCRAIMAQRLVRKVCQKCKEPYTPTPYEMQLLKLDPRELEKTTIYRGRGCPECGKTGYRGRTGIYEIFELNDEVRQLIYEHVSSNVLRARGREMGMRTLREDGVRKIMAGITTAEEVISITQGDED